VSLLLQSVPLNTDGTGAVVRDVRFAPGRLHAVRIELDTLDTPDITITDEPIGDTILALTGVAADVTKYPTVLGQGSNGVNIAGAAVAYPVFGRLHIVIAGGGANKTGRLVLFVER